MRPHVAPFREDPVRTCAAYLLVGCWQNAIREYDTCTESDSGYFGPIWFVYW